MSRGIKIAAGIVLGIVGLVVIAAILAVLFVDLNRFKPQIEQAVQEQTGRTLQIEGDIGWSLYPVLGIELGQTTLSNAPGFGEQPMASIQQVSVGVSLLPLLGGNLNISELVLQRPQIMLARKADGTTNWDDLIQKQQEAQPQEEPQPEQQDSTGQPLQIAIEGVSLTDADILWRDEMNDQQVRIAPLTLSTGPIQPGTPTDLELVLAVANENPQVNANLRLTTRVTSAEDLAWVEWQDLALQLKAQGAAIPAKQATLTFNSSGRIHLQDQTLDMQRSILAFEVPELEQTMHAKGQLSLSVQGNLEAQTFSSEDLAFQALVTGPELPGGQANLDLTTPFSVDLNQQTLSLPAIAASALGLKLNAKVEGSQIVDNPQLKGELQLAQFAPRVLMERLNIELPPMNGPNALEKAAFSTQFNATTSTANLSQLKILFDDSNLNGNAQVKLGDKTDAQFELVMDQIVVDRYLPPPTEDDDATPAPADSGASEQAPGTTASSAEQPASDPFAWMETINLNGSIKIGKVLVKDTPLTDVVANIRVQDQVLTLDPALTAFGGRQTAQVQVDARGDTPKTQVKTGLRLGQVESMLRTIMNQPPLEGSGSLDLALSLEGLTLPEIQKSLQGGGELRITDGAFNGVDILESIRSSVASLRGKEVKASQKETELKNFISRFSIEGGALQWNQLDAEAGDVKLNAEGGLNLFSQELDTILNVQVPETLKDKNDFLSELAGQTIPVQLGGTLTSPKIGLDLQNVIRSQIEQKIDSKVDEKKQELQQKLDDKVQKGLQQLFKR